MRTNLAKLVADLTDAELAERLEAFRVAGDDDVVVKLLVAEMDDRARKDAKQARACGPMA